MPLDNYLYNNRLYEQLMNFRDNEIKIAKNIQQNSVNPTCKGCAKLSNILNYQTVPILTQVLTGKFLLLPLYLGCTTNKRGIPIGYIFYLLIQGHQCLHS